MNASHRPPLPEPGRRRLNLGLAGAIALPLCGGAWAQAGYPSKPVRMVVPFVPGGITDATARTVGDKLQSLLGVSVVVDNRAGASGNIGSLHAAQAEPDGYTLLLIPDGNFLITPHVYKNLGYEPLRDFATIGKVGDSTLMLVASAAGTIRNLGDVIAQAKSSPKGLLYATSGVASNSQIAAELLRQRGNINLVHVPYSKGVGPAITDLIGGQLPLVVSSTAGAIPLIKAGKLQPICVFTANRLASLPEVPTATEAGVPVVYNSWIGIFAPAKTPRAIVTRLSAALRTVISTPETNAKLSEMGVVPQLALTPEAFTEEIRRDMVAIGETVKKAGITAES